MTNVQDVAAYILKARGPMTAMKLQKLCYYAQAWHLVWQEQALFPERVEAWANGPVVYELYRRHRGAFQVASLGTGDGEALTPNEAGTVDAVLRSYGSLPAHELSDLTHREAPWRLARDRAGLRPGDRGTPEITIADMFEFYDGLIAPPEPHVPVDLERRAKARRLSARLEANPDYQKALKRVADGPAPDAQRGLTAGDMMAILGTA